jgi:hypothetical protein
MKTLIILAFILMVPFVGFTQSDQLMGPMEPLEFTEIIDSTDVTPSELEKIADLSDSLRMYKLRVYYIQREIERQNEAVGIMKWLIFTEAGLILALTLSK